MKRQRTERSTAEMARNCRIGHQQEGTIQRGLPSFYMEGPHETMTVNWAVHEQEETTWGSPDSSCYGVEKKVQFCYCSTKSVTDNM